MRCGVNLAESCLLRSAGLTAFARILGDGMTRLDRIESDLKEVLPGNVRDTTTPVAMLSDLRKLVLGDALLPSSKARLTEWLIDNKTGGNRLRAGLPPKWKVGDKTGSGDRGTTNAVAIVRPPDGAPILVAGYLAEQRWTAIRAI
jgi:beta-lactamase class A